MENLGDILEAETVASLMECSYEANLNLEMNNARRRLTWIALTGFIFFPTVAVDSLKSQGMLDSILKTILEVPFQYKSTIANKVLLDSKI